MAGILNSKNRIFDTIITQEGRRQIAEGELKATYVSFTDSSAIYHRDTIVSGGLDETHRIILEAGNSLHDSITLEADDSGLLQAFPISGSTAFPIRMGQVLSSSQNGTLAPVTGSQFNSLAGALLSSSIDNFKNLYLLQSPDPLTLKEKEFLIGPTSAKFTITGENPIPSDDMQVANVDQLETLFYDKRLTHVPNFDFLPPVNKPKPGKTETTPLGNYVSLNQEPIESFQQVLDEINDYDNKGYGVTVNFTETSKENNVFGQFFEIARGGTMTKLDVVDFGEFESSEGTKHVFYVGKVFLDSFGANTFINMFTLIFER